MRKNLKTKPADLVPVTLSSWKGEEDRARDFIAVFHGQSTKEQGERVLLQIEIWCSPAPLRDHADHPGLLAFKEGRRSILKDIIDARDMKRARVPEIQRKPPDA